MITWRTELVRGLRVVLVDNGPLALAFLPQVGGRLISLRLHGDEVLWHNAELLGPSLHPIQPYEDWPQPDGTMGSWVNVGGGKTWPAPQGWSGPDEWPGPPDPVIDSGEYDLTVEDLKGSLVLTLTSAVDGRTGLQVSRRFTIVPEQYGFAQTSTFTNAGVTPRRWSVWEVVQVDTARGGELVVDVDSDAEPLRLVDGVGALDSRLEGLAAVVPVQDVVGKLGFTSATGRVAYARGDGLTVELTSARVPGLPYPDGGCPVELWLQCPVAEPLEHLGGLHPKVRLAELELLSPLTAIGPGESVGLDLTWRLSRRP